MKEVLFKDGRKSLVDADLAQCFQGGLALYKRRSDGSGRDLVRSYNFSLPEQQVKMVEDYNVSPIKLLAIKLYTACNHVPHGSKKLAEIADVEYSDMIIPVLKKLRDAGKVVFEEGKWRRA